MNEYSLKIFDKTSPIYMGTYPGNTAEEVLNQITDRTGRLCIVQERKGVWIVHPIENLRIVIKQTKIDGYEIQSRS